MPDMEKVIKGLEWCGNARGCNWGCPYWDQFDLDSDGKLGCIHTMQLDALTLLKEQKKQRFFVDESGKITPLPVVVRCEDCKHSKRYGGLYGCEFGNGLHDKDWYCADGERESEDA